jgi:peptide-methionine (R)-S-oxide reductase
MGASLESCTRREISVTQQLKVVKAEDEWRKQLGDLEYHVLREAGTERPFTGEYTDTTMEGVYECRACGAELFRSDEKFESHCGWPSFFAPLAEDRVVYLEDKTLGSARVEVRCASCGSHLGHVFHGEGYETPTDDRYCINSVCLVLKPAR